jgi:hypothetical protein
MALGSVVVAVCPCISRAASISYTDSVPVQRTNWSSSVTVPQFDPSLGTLDSIEFKLKGTVTGLARFESRDNGPTTVVMMLKAKVTLMRPDLSPLVVVLPLVQTSDNVTAFDGIIDFGGTSGRTYDNLSGDLTDSNVLNPPGPVDLATFVGLGNVTLPATAEGMSFGSGSGNLVQQFMTNAGAEATVTYNYHVPEPGVLGMVLVGGLALFVRRR